MSRATFKETLQQATFAPNRALDSGIDEVDLGTFHQRASELMRKTVTDPSHRSFSKPVFVGSDRRVFIWSEEYVSGQEPSFENNLGLKPDSSKLPKEQRQDRFIGAFIRSHPISRPFPIVDMFKLMAPDDNPEARTAVFVADPLNLSIIFRSQETPVFSNEYVDERAEIVMNGIDTFLGNSILRPLAESQLVQATVSRMLERGRLKVFSCASNEQIARLKK